MRHLRAYNDPAGPFRAADRLTLHELTGAPLEPPTSPDLARPVDDYAFHGSAGGEVHSLRRALRSAHAEINRLRALLRVT